MNIFQRIAAVMDDVQYLAKDDTVSTGQGKGYKAITEEKVTSTVRASMLKNGLVMFPESMSTSRTDEQVEDKYGNVKTNRITTVDVIYRMVNKDDPNEFINIASSGTGVDTQDKGVGKAMTYAYKYALLRTFAVPTGEDPDKISSDVYTEMLIGKPTPKEEPPKMMSKEENWNVICGLFEVNGKTAEDAKAWIESRYKLPFDKLTATQIATAKVDVARKSNGTSGK